jgi:hypothetical protein
VTTPVALTTDAAAYTVGGGAIAAERKELAIWSWDLEAEPQGLF